MPSTPSYRRLACGLLALVLGGGCAARTTAPGTPFVIELAPGVFMRDANGRQASNQAFVIFDSYVVVFDPSNVLQARPLLKEIRSRTSKPIRYVINSHFHPDHSTGAAVFAPLGAEIVAAASARRDFDVWARNDFVEKLVRRPTVYGGLAYSPPTRYIADTWVLDDGVQRLEVMHYGHGHTRGDLVGWLPRQRILFAGDLSTNGQHNLANANLSGWISVLDRLQALGARQVVPGHKRLAGPEMLDKSHRYLFELRAKVRRMVKRGMTYDEILATIDIPFYEEWSGVSVRNEPQHVARAYKEAGGKSRGRGRLLTRRRLAAVTIIGIVGAGPIALLRRLRRSRTARSSGGAS